jgi:hypothetical protein
MTRDAAEKIMQRLMCATGDLNEAVRLVQAEAPEVVFKEFRMQTGQVMAAIYLDLIKRIVKLHPDLDPAREESGGDDQPG